MGDLDEISLDELTMSDELFIGGHRHKLSKREERYCNCLMHVRSKKGISAPYGICTRSVYNQQGMKRSKMVDCDNHYKFSNYSKKELVALAEEKDIKIDKSANQTKIANKLQKVLNPNGQKRYLIKKY
jgi:hypothetical protein